MKSWLKKRRIYVDALRVKPTEDNNKQHKQRHGVYEFTIPDNAGESRIHVFLLSQNWPLSLFIVTKKACYKPDPVFILVVGNEHESGLKSRPASSCKPPPNTQTFELSNCGSTADFKNKSW